MPPTASVPAPPRLLGEGSSGQAPNFLAEVVAPLYAVVRRRTKEHDGPGRMTYDDLNEFFWAEGCLQWQPFASRPACVASALSRRAYTPPPSSTLSPALTLPYPYP